MREVGHKRSSEVTYGSGTTQGSLVNDAGTGSLLSSFVFDVSQSLPYFLFNRSAVEIW